MSREFEAVIIGMGPAGMAAAVELAGLGVTTAIVDENPEPGGQIYRQPPADFTLHKPGFLGSDQKNGRKQIENFRSCRDKLTVLSKAYIWGVFDGSSLAIAQNGQIRLMTFKKLLLAEGAMERSIPFPGWTLPGVMLPGGLQRLIVHERLLPGKNFVLAGNSPLLLPVAASILKAGGKIVSLCYANRIGHYLKMLPALMGQKSLVREILGYYWQLLRCAAPTLRPFTVVSASGESRVEEVTVAKLDEDWKQIPGSEKKFRADVVGVGYAFLPSARLARLCGCDHDYDPIRMHWKPRTDPFMRTSRPDVYVAGDSAAIGGADKAAAEGRIAAIHLASQLGRLSDDKRDKRMEVLFKDREKIERYVSAFNNTFTPRPGIYSAVDEETIVCRCEKVTAGDVFAGIELGYRNINEIKRTRVGMGLCQARTCESMVAQLMIHKGIPVEEIGYLGLRPPLSPIPLSQFELASHDPGWGVNHGRW